jgi:hypothetical protein
VFLKVWSVLGLLALKPARQSRRLVRHTDYSTIFCLESGGEWFLYFKRTPKIFKHLKIHNLFAGWFTAVILVTWEAKIWRIMVPGKPRRKKFVRHHLNGKKVGHGGRCLSFQLWWEA